jgi:hypothetical protein
MRLLVAIAALLLQGCNYTAGPLPTEAQVARADQAVMNNSCVRAGGLWARQYQYHIKPDNLPASLRLLDRQIIDFALYGVTDPRKARAAVVPPSPSFRLTIFDAPVPMAGGSYDLTNLRLNMRYCAPNWPRS